jgi:hypothetical protein
VAKKISVDVQALYVIIEAQEKAIKALQETIDRLRNTGAGQFVFPPITSIPPSPLVPFPYQPYIGDSTWPSTTICGGTAGAMGTGAMCQTNANLGEAH